MVADGFSFCTVADNGIGIVWSLILNEEFVATVGAVEESSIPMQRLQQFDPSRPAIVLRDRFIVKSVDHRSMAKDAEKHSPAFGRNQEKD